MAVSTRVTHVLIFHPPRPLRALEAVLSQARPSVSGPPAAEKVPRPRNGQRPQPHSTKTGGGRRGGSLLPGRAEVEGAAGQVSPPVSHKQGSRTTRGSRSPA